MALSWSGILTLVVAILGGPCVFAILKFMRSGREEVIDEPEDRAEGEREQVDGMGYLMALLGYAIGIGNVWRFPYLVGQWGGGAFVLAYVICMVTVATPLFFFELALGNQLRKNSLDALTAIHPRWKGLGYAQAIMVFCILLYFNVLIAYALLYVCASIFDPLPWAGDSKQAQHYWFNTILNMYRFDDHNGEIHAFGDDGFLNVQWYLIGGLFVVYVGIFFAIAFGKEMLAKITWVTVIGPILAIIIMLVQSFFLEGSWDGVMFYIGKFDSAKLADVELWSTACSQILFSLSPGMGTAITMSSFTKRNTDVYKTALIVSAANSAFSLIGGVAMFGILGNLAHKSGQPVDELAQKSGAGLAFIVIADAMDGFGVFSNFMSVLFFGTLIMLGLDSSFAWIETLISIIGDYCRKKGYAISKIHMTMGLCITLFILGIPLCTRIGGPLRDALDDFVGTVFLLFACCVESIILVNGYTFARAAHVLKNCTVGNPDTPNGRDVWPQAFWNVCITFVTPVATMVLFGFKVGSLVSQPYNEAAQLPNWLVAIGATALFACTAALFSTSGTRGTSTLEDLEPKPSTTQSELPFMSSAAGSVVSTNQ
eukprot:TRINITY_DN74324_c0_g1_i1.p1 TRINITY_DN74324_c0_g1~~TRINITY_DN74324_c0_g1_i1.p1  ORF type:complete len:597 (-),score=79.06 TRINITY_DN74324_c0_g1_i1:83-1873(-)